MPRGRPRGLDLYLPGELFLAFACPGQPRGCLFLSASTAFPRMGLPMGESRGGDPFDSYWSGTGGLLEDVQTSGLSRLKFFAKRSRCGVRVTLYPVFATVTLVGAGTLSVPAQGKVSPTPIPFFAGISMLPGERKAGRQPTTKTNVYFATAANPPPATPSHNIEMRRRSRS